MRKLSVQTFLTLDGVMQGPGGPGEDDSGGFTHGGWSVKYWDDQMGQVVIESMSRPFVMLLGRRTYEIFAAHWPRVTDDPAADVLNGAKKHVASTTLDKVEWRNSTLLKGDVGAAVVKLKEEVGPEIQVHGSGNLIQTLMKHDLVDEFRLWTFPVLLGSGKRLFANGTIPRGLRIMQTRTSSTGVIMTRYERAGDIDYGTFRLE